MLDLGQLFLFPVSIETSSKGPFLKLGIPLSNFGYVEGLEALVIRTNCKKLSSPLSPALIRNNPIPVIVTCK